MIFLVDKALWYLSGVYKITNVVTGDFYVGSAKSIKKRYLSHKSKLNRGDHHNEHLTASYHKHGSNCFEFSVLEICAVESRFAKEQYYIDTLLPKYNKKLRVEVWGYDLETRKHRRKNRFKSAGVGTGNYPRTPEHILNMKKAFEGKSHSKETIEKRANSRRGVPSKLRGRPLSEEHKAKVIAALKTCDRNFYSKLSEREVLDIKILLKMGFSYSFIAGFFAVTSSNIAAIDNKLSWIEVVCGNEDRLNLLGFFEGPSFYKKFDVNTTVFVWRDVLLYTLYAERRALCTVDIAKILYPDKSGVELRTATIRLSTAIKYLVDSGDAFLKSGYVGRNMCIWLEIFELTEEDNLLYL